jgi:hypothetical protein
MLIGLALGVEGRSERKIFFFLSGREENMGCALLLALLALLFVFFS